MSWWSGSAHAAHIACFDMVILVAYGIWEVAIGDCLAEIGQCHESICTRVGGHRSLSPVSVL